MAVTPKSRDSTVRVNAIAAAAFRQRARLVLERSAAYPARMLEVMAGEAVTG